VGDLDVKVRQQIVERSEALAALKSSNAFLGRGFRDIEMLLEAVFRELEDSRLGFMAQQRKRFKARLDRERMRYAKRQGAGGALPPLHEDDDSFSATSPDVKSAPRLSVLSRLTGRGRGGEGEGEDAEEAADSESDDLSSLASEEIERMDYDELQARLAANEAKERRSLGKKMGGEDEVLLQESAEVEAADVRRVEFASLAQSKMGKQAQIEELSERVAKEGIAAEKLATKLEAALVDEQDVLKQWAKLDEQLQEAEIEKAQLVTAKQREKEVALEKAQVAEASLEELKENYRNLRRQEEKSLKDISDAESASEEAARSLDEQAERLRHQKQLWTDQLHAAEVDRRQLLGEAQSVEAEMRGEQARKAEAQHSASHYRNLLNSYM